MKNFKKYAPKKGCVLVLKSLAANLVAAHNEFQWTEKGQVVCPDWKPTKECGNGLHGWKWGEGDAGLGCKDDDAKWLVLSVVEADIIDLTDKVKFPQCEVVYCGTRDEAVQIIQHYAPAGNKCIYGTATAGYRGTATAGDSGTATAGDSGTATAGYRGTATAGDSGTATAGYSGTATAGYRGTATAGDSGTATAGYSGTATAGYSGTATAGMWGFIAIEFWDRDNKVYRKKMAQIDGVNFLPGVKYRLNSDNEFEEVKNGQ